MSLTKDGFYKQLGGAVGNNNYLLEAGGGHIGWGNAASQIPYSNGTVNSNLNADMVDSLHIHTGRNNEANKLVRTDGSGYIQAGYINSSSGDENNNSSPNRVWGTNGSDSYLRTYRTSALNVGSSTNLNRVSGGFTTGGAGWFKLASIKSTDARGVFRISIYTTGGNWIPEYCELMIRNGWSIIDFIQYGQSSYIDGYRYTVDDTYSYVEAHFTGNTTFSTLKFSGVGYVNDNNYGWSLYTSAVTGSGTVQGSEYTKTTTSNKLFINGLIEGSGFQKSGSSNSYVLLGGGGHESLSNLGSYHNHDDRYVNITGDTMSSGAQIIVGTKSKGSSDVYNGGIQLREATYSTTSCTNNMYDAPGITFHWRGWWVHKLNMQSNDIFWDNNRIWHSGNDGSGSGLDADLLDGMNSTEFVPKRHTERFYPFVNSSYGQPWYKITLPWAGYTSGSNAWMTTTMEIVLGGSYDNGNNGRIYLQYYFSKNSSNGWSAGTVRGTTIGYRLIENGVTIKYDIANPGIFYIKANANTYNSIGLENITANDTAPNFDFRNTTIEAIAESSVPSAANQTVPLYHTITTQNGYWANLNIQTSASNTTVPSFGAIRMNGASSAGTNYITGSAGRIFFGGNFHIDSLGSNATYINHYTSNNVYLVTGGGKAGIGTASPSYKLHVTGDIYANGGWLRTSGAYGWYSESYGGGIYMTDSTWVRTYNGKGMVAANFYATNWASATYLLRSDGGAAAFNWSGQSGQPTWVWGGNSQHTYYVYNPSNFSVNYANSAGSATNASWLTPQSNFHTGRALGYAQTSNGPLNGSNSTGTPTSWAHYILMSHDNGQTYFHYQLAFPFWDAPMYQRKEGGSSTSENQKPWYKFITTENYESILNMKWTNKWGPSDSYTFANNGLRIQQTSDETSGIHFNGDYINMWSPCDGNYSLRYFDEDNGGEVWNISSSGHFSGSAASANYATSAGNADTVDGYHWNAFTSAAWSFNWGADYGATTNTSLATWVSRLNSQGGIRGYASISCGSWWWVRSIDLQVSNFNIRTSGAMVIYAGDASFSSQNYKHFLVVDAEGEIYTVTSNEESWKKYRKFLTTDNWSSYISTGSNLYQSHNGTTSNLYPMGSSTAGSGNRTTLYTRGEFYFNNTGAYHTSDIRKKHDIRDIYNKDVIDLFNTENAFIRFFRWKEDNQAAYGFIAQELQEYCPEAVDFNNDTGFYSVNYNVAFSKIVGAMFKKIKELEKRLKEKENS